MLLSQSGEYLVHPEADREWGFELEHEWNLQVDLPEIADTVLASTTGVERSGGEMVAHAPVYPKPGWNTHWVLVRTVPEAVVLAGVAKVRNASLLLLLICPCRFGVGGCRDGRASPS